MAEPTEVEPISVLLVDDHPLWRESLAKILRRRPGIEVVAEVGTGEEAISAVVAHGPDVVVMDVDMPGIGGIDAVERLRSDDPALAILMLSASSERSTVVAAVTAGAAGYLVKTAGAAEVADAVTRVHRGELVLPPTMAQAVLSSLRSNGASVTGLDALTDAETAVLERMAEGRSNQAIAGELHIAVKTVEARVTSIYTKLGLQPDAADHRRVLAVVEWLRGQGPA